MDPASIIPYGQPLHVAPGHLKHLKHDYGITRTANQVLVTNYHFPTQTGLGNRLSSALTFSSIMIFLENILMKVSQNIY